MSLRKSNMLSREMAGIFYLPESQVIAQLNYLGNALETVRFRPVITCRGFLGMEITDPQGNWRPIFHQSGSTVFGSWQMGMFLWENLRFPAVITIEEDHTCDLLTNLWRVVNGVPGDDWMSHLSATLRMPPECIREELFTAEKQYPDNRIIAYIHGQLQHNQRASFTREVQVAIRENFITWDESLGDIVSAEERFKYEY